MTTRRLLTSALAVPLSLALVLGACGGDDDGDAADAPDTTEAGDATTATADDSTATTATDTTGAAGDGAAAEGDAAAGEAVATVFDSAVPFEDKVALIEGGEGHRADHEAYVTAADAVGGISLEPTDVAVDGDTATVTYRVLFGGNEAYADLTMDLARSGDGWVVPTTAFCGFLASARTPCTAA